MIINWFIFPPHIASASALPGKTRKHGISIFRTNALIASLPDFDQSLLHFFSLVDARLKLCAIFDSLNLVLCGISFELLGPELRMSGV